MIDANSEAASEAAAATEPISELDAYLAACRSYKARTGNPPNEGQRSVLLRQVRGGFIDGTESAIDHADEMPSAWTRHNPDAIAALGRDELDGLLAHLDESDGGVHVLRAVENGQPHIRLAEGSPTQIAVDQLGELEARAREAHSAAADEAHAILREGVQSGSTVTIAQAAQLTGLSQRAIRARVDRGTLRAVKGRDGLRRIPVSELYVHGLMELERSGSEEQVPPAAEAARQGDTIEVVRQLWQSAEQALREAADLKLLTVQSEARLSEANAHAARLELELHEARAEAAAAVARAEHAEAAAAEAEATAAAKMEAETASASARRRWWQRR